MKKTSLLIISVIFIVVTIFIVLKSSISEKPFANVEFENENYVTNTTDEKFMDTIVRVGLDVLDIEGLQVAILPLDSEMKEALGSDIQLQAYVKKQNSRFLIYIENLDRKSAIDVISHELIHIKQYLENRIVVTGGWVLWGNQEYNAEYFPYSERPWEIEAFALQDGLKNLIVKKLY